MRPRPPVVLLPALLLPAVLLCACTDAAEPAGEPPTDRSPTAITTDRTTGTVESVTPDGRFVTVDHAPLPAIGMGAMRMGIDVKDGVDVSDLRGGDRVLFSIEAGDSIGIRITDICVPAREGENCLRSP